MTTIMRVVISMAATAVRRVWGVPSRRTTAKNANALIPTRKRQNYRHAARKRTRVMATVTMTITMRVVVSMAVTAARRVWEVPSRKTTAKNASVLIRVPKGLHVVKSSTRVMATATMTITMRVVISMAATAVRRVWGVPSRKITAKNVNVYNINCDVIIDSV